ncbi:MAG: penicillin-binding protein 1A [Acidaminococcus sp.]|jgi:penicillin-binding protein 1A|nr:penicillin-binding protein 1A [Acidaminococcus sp.]MCI2117071.1 penicillin-binding protein 1A [Acidaminococcus sp.]
MTLKGNKSWKKPFGPNGSGKRKKLGGMILSAVLALILVGFLSIAAFFALAKFTTAKILSKDMVPMASSQFFDANGDLMTTVDSEEDRIPVSIDKVPKNLQNAFLAAEDIRFYNHGGIDFKGIGRAIYTYIRYGEVQGGSTITQQLAKNYFLTQERTLTRKIHEAFIALQIEQKYTKKEIFEMYMNQIYFGQGAYGVETAANTYFGKHVEDLDLAECAMLAGIPKSPNYYNPLSNPKAAKERQSTVLDQMEKYGFISAEQHKKAYEEKLTYKSLTTNPGSKSYFINYCIQILIDKFGPDAVYKQGLKVYTSLDPDMQKAAEKAAALTPTYYTDSNKLKQPQSAIVAVDPKTGYIKAMIGGRGTDQFNRAVMAERQPGSSFKPFVYLNAMEHGATPNSIVDDSPIPGSWNPQNFDRRFRGKVTYRTALTYSYNVSAIKVAEKYGFENVIKLAKKMGITTLVEDGPQTDANGSMALGGLTYGVTPLEMAGAYGAIANMGKYNKPTPIIKIVDRNGKTIYEHKVNPVQVAKESSVYMLISMMKDVMTRGTGRGARISRPCAGKTGTTSDYVDAWFVGFTPNLSCAVWIGDDNNESLGGMTGGGEPATLWRTFMADAVADLPAEDFKKPAGFKEPERVEDPAPAKKTTDKKKDDKKKDQKTTTDSKTNTGNSKTSKSNSSSKSGGAKVAPPPVKPPKQ